MEIMNKKVLTNIEEITPKWFTGILRKKEKWSNCTVTNLNFRKKLETHISIVGYLDVKIFENSKKRSDISILVKVSKPETLLEVSAKFCAREVDFYNRVIKYVVNPPTVDCYDAAFSEQLGRGHVILEDISSQYSQPTMPIPPTECQCMQSLNSLAKFHAFWWKNPLLGTSVGNVLSKTELAKYIEEHEKRLWYFENYLGELLSDKRKEIYKLVLNSLPLLWNRLTHLDNQTLIHGDSHFWNFLYPNDASRSEAIMIDWQNWKINLPTNDLAYMIALFCYPEHRSRLEEKLLVKYYQSLLTGQVHDYTWEHFIRDYKTSVIRNLFVPVWQCTQNVSPSLWWPHLETAFLAFSDWNCLDLLS
jgi:thiamine kinase-like enzyme